MHPSAQFKGNEPGSAKKEGGTSHPSGCFRAIMPIMVGAVAGIRDVLVPPSRFGVHPVVREGFPLQDFPSSKASGLEAAVFDFINRIKSGAISELI